MHRLIIWAVVCAVLFWAAGCSTSGEAPKVQTRGDSGPNPVPEAGPWTEAGLVLPPYPREQDLIPFESTGQTTNRFYIDGSSLSVGSDQVVRFTLVIRSAQDARNVSYSGVRCTSSEWKDYAFGQEAKRWEANSNPTWRRIVDQRINNYQHTLASAFFCTAGVVSSGAIGDAKSIVRSLKYPAPYDNRVPNARY